MCIPLLCHQVLADNLRSVPLRAHVSLHLTAVNLVSLNSMHSGCGVIFSLKDFPGRNSPCTMYSRPPKCMGCSMFYFLVYESKGSPLRWKKLPTGHTLVDSTLFPCHFNEISLNQCGIDASLTFVPNGSSLLYWTWSVFLSN